LPYPTMPDVLLGGSVDAVIVAEPFATILKNRGGVPLGNPFPPGMPYSVYIADKTWAEEHPDVVDRFVRAISKTSDRLQNDLELQFEQIEAYTGMESDLIETIVLE